MTERDSNAAVIAEFRANRGVVGGMLAQTPILLLHHTGARSGRPRITPLACQRDRLGRFVLVGSNGGSPIQPAWCHNLRARPQVTVEVGAERFDAVAMEVAGEARARLLYRLAAAAPSLGEFAARTRRTIPVFVLMRVKTHAPQARHGRIR